MSTGSGNTGPVIVVGGANLDVIGRPASPLVDRDSNPGTVTFAVGGVGRNIAENLARLNVPTALITALGDGPAGEMVLARCREAGIDMSGSLRLAGDVSSAYIAILDSEGDMVLALSDMSAVDRLAPEVLEERRDIFEEADIIVADANLPAESLAWLAEGLPGIPLYVDPVSTAKAAKVSGLLPGIHTLKLNALEASILVDGPVTSPEGALAAGRELRSRGAGRVVVTLGTDAVCWVSSEGEGTFSPRRRRTVDATGAGDAFMAGLVCADLEGRAPAEAVAFASAAGASAAESASAVNPLMSRESVERMMK